MSPALPILPELPEEYLVLVMMIGCFVLVCLGHNGEIKSILALIAGYLAGRVRSRKEEEAEGGS